MAHWKEALPQKIFSLNYEDLIDEPERATRELLAFCDVAWNENCLRFHDTTRAVTTASNFQVRRPLNRRGLARWKNYEAQICPLIEALEEFDQAPKK